MQGKMCKKKEAATASKNGDIETIDLFYYYFPESQLHFSKICSFQEIST